MQKFYEGTKRVYGPLKRSTMPVRSADGNSLIRDKSGILERWKEHFNMLLNIHKPTDHSVLDELQSSPVRKDLDSPPTLEEVVNAITGLKSRKSPGPDDVPSELLIHGGKKLHEFLHKMISQIWNDPNLTVPNSWKDATVVTIYKNKGDRAVCGNSRGISLLGAAGKVFARFLLKRLVDTISEGILPDTQCGFRSNRSTIDMIFAARQLLEKSREQHRNLYVAFIDLSKAFDSVDRDLMWRILEKCGCTKRFVQMIRSLHDGMAVRIRIGNDLSEPFEVSRGVKQGCVLAPVLFNIYVQCFALYIYVQCITRLLAQHLEQNCRIRLNYRTDRNLFDTSKLKAKSKISQTDLLELQYADDCALVSDSPEALQSVLSHTSNFYKRLGLSINITKTEFLKYNPIPHQNTVNIYIDGLPLKEVNCFKYLGSHISANCHLDDEIHFRLQQANCAFGRLRQRVFQNRNISLKTKVQVYNAIVLTSLLYGSETWTLYQHHLRSLEQFHMRSLRRILEISWKDKVPDIKVLEKTNSVSLENTIYRSQLRWIGHVVRMDDDRLPKQLLYGELAQGKRNAGGQKKRYRDQTLRILKTCQIDHKQLEELANNRTNWRSTVYKHLRQHEEDRISWLKERRQKRKESKITTSTTEHVCSECGRSCLSPIGLVSHQRAHQRRRMVNKL